MPNWCVTNYVVEGKKEELDDLYQKMKGLQGMEQPLVENGFGQTWLGCLVQSLGADPEDVGCRGNWDELERRDDTLRFDFWSALRQTVKLMLTILTLEIPCRQAF